MEIGSIIKMDQKLGIVSLRLQKWSFYEKEVEKIFLKNQNQSVAITEQYQLKLDLTSSKILLTTLAQGNVKPHHQLRIGKITARLEWSIQR